MYTRYRMLHGIAEGPEIANKIPLECNLDLLNYISFSKGCYVGQELVARTKHKGMVRKRILPFLRPVSGVGGSASFDRLDGKVAGAIAASSMVDVAPANRTHYVSKGDNLIAIASEGEGDVKGGEAGSVISTTKGQELGLALVRLDRVFPKESADVSNKGMEGGEGGGNNNKKEDTTAKFRVQRNKEEGRGETNDTDTDTDTADACVVRVFRPSWWPDVDPITEKSTLTI